MFCFGPHSMWYLGSSTRGLPRPPALEVPNLNLWTIREVSKSEFFCFFFFFNESCMRLTSLMNSFVTTCKERCRSQAKVLCQIVP